MLSAHSWHSRGGKRLLSVATAAYAMLAFANLLTGSGIRTPVVQSSSTNDAFDFVKIERIRPAHPFGVDFKVPTSPRLPKRWAQRNPASRNLATCGTRCGCSCVQGRPVVVDAVVDFLSALALPSHVSASHGERSSLERGENGPQRSGWLSHHDQSAAISGSCELSVRKP